MTINLCALRSDLLPVPSLSYQYYYYQLLKHLQSLIFLHPSLQSYMVLGLMKLCTCFVSGKLLNGRQHLLEFKPVGDHKTPGGDFRIRSAVLWLKVEHLQQTHQQHQQQQQQAQRDTDNNEDTTSGGGGRNITIWIFNMKTSGPWESKTDDCAVNYGTQNEEKVVSNCPSSELPAEEATFNRDEARDANQELNLNEKVKETFLALSLLFIFNFRQW